MSDTQEVQDLLHVRFNRVDAAIATLTDRMDDMGRRLTALETETRQGLAQVQVNLANLSLRLDAFEGRMARIERRLACDWGEVED